MLYNLANIFNISIDNLLEVNKNNDDMNLKKEKIALISKYCNNLSSSELNFLIKIIKTMSDNIK